MNRQFGPVMQNGFVVSDLDEALRHWTETMHVGPFFVFEHVAFENLHFRGAPADVDITVAIGYSGDYQIELIVQHNNTPSIYTEFVQQGYPGLQHLGVMTDDVDAHLEQLAPQGIEPVQYGTTRGGGKFAYLNTDVHPGGMIELIEASDVMVGAFEMMRTAAQRWDGSNPVRKLG